MHMISIYYYISLESHDTIAIIAERRITTDLEEERSVAQHGYSSTGFLFQLSTPGTRGSQESELRNSVESHDGLIG